MIKRKLASVILASILIVIAVTLVLSGQHASTKSAHKHVIEEDQAGWDCHTMGNKICGPKTNG